MLSASGHKINGPKGIGIMYLRNGVQIESFVHGGAQERGKHINMAFIHIDWHMSICLYRICMEENLMLLRDLANLLDWLDASDLVICKLTEIRIVSSRY